jgi:hypothetical protein
MSLEGHIHDGMVVFSQPVPLPEGTRVRVEPSNGFWQNKTIDELAREQRVQPIAAIEDLAGEWPEDDSIEEMLALIRKSRA